MQRKATSLFGSGLLVLSLCSWNPHGVHLFELLGAFAHFTFFFSVLVLLIASIYRHGVLVMLSLGSAILCAALVVPHLLSLNSSANGNITIGQFNVYHGNTSPQAAFEELSGSETDVLIVQELNIRWSSILNSNLRKDYPYRIEEPWQNCCYGIALYSKFPILDSKIFDLEGTPAIRATINADGSEINIITFHTRPPVFPNETEERNNQLRAVAIMAPQISGPLIVLGDLNVVPWDAEFKSFLKASNLKTVRDGFQATYPMDFGIPLIPIDYITYSKELIPTSSKTIKIPGSDHKGIVASFKLE